MYLLLIQPVKTKEIQATMIYRNLYSNPKLRCNSSCSSNSRFENLMKVHNNSCTSLVSQGHHNHEHFHRHLLIVFLLNPLKKINPRQNSDIDCLGQNILKTHPDEEKSQFINYSKWRLSILGFLFPLLFQEFHQM